MNWVTLHFCTIKQSKSEKRNVVKIIMFLTCETFREEEFSNKCRQLFPLAKLATSHYSKTGYHCKKQCFLDSKTRFWKIQTIFKAVCRENIEAKLGEIPLTILMRRIHLILGWILLLEAHVYIHRIPLRKTHLRIKRLQRKRKGRDEN